MDINDLRSGVTLVSLLLFIVLMVWTWRPRAKPEHDAAARLPFDGEQPSNAQGNGGRGRE